MRRATSFITASASCAMALAATAANETPASSPEARWNAVVACAARPDERQRHQCVDEVLRQSGVLTDAQDQRDQRQRFGRDAVTPATRTTEPESLAFELAAVSESRDGRLTFTTRDGTVWRQTESREFAQTPRAGQTLTVHRGLLGNFLCDIDGRSAFRCSRSR